MYTFKRHYISGAYIRNKKVSSFIYLNEQELWFNFVFLDDMYKNKLESIVYSLIDLRELPLASMKLEKYLKEFCEIKEELHNV